MKTYKIEIAVDTEQAEEFAAWLNARGHNATLGTSTGNYIDGTWTSTDEQANEIMRELWESFAIPNLTPPGGDAPGESRNKMKVTITYSGLTRSINIRNDKNSVTLDVSNDEGKNIGAIMSLADARVIATALIEASKGK